MIGLRGKSAVFSVLALLVALGALAALAGCGGSPSALLAAGGEVTQGASTDSPAIILGGYMFGPTSDRLTHPYFRIMAATAQATWKGWGSRFAGRKMTAAFSSGGSVAGVKTVRVLITMPGETTVHQEYNWFAQDTQGNVHFMRYQEINDGTGKGHPPQLQGVAAGRKPRFWLVKSTLLKVNYVWYAYEDSRRPTRRTRQFKVLGTNATVHGRDGLLYLQDIEDENGDGIFSPSFTGPDRRQDFYFQKTGVSLFAILLASNLAGGFALR